MSEGYMTDILTGILKESYALLNAMSPYLLFGFFVAGLLHIFFDPAGIAKHFGKPDIMSVLKASLFGVPLPLCSCGVIPAALQLKREGASKGAILSFLISTPTTGVDSIFATYALMGGFFAAYRVLASFVTAILCGLLVNVFTRPYAPIEDPGASKDCSCCSGHARPVSERGLPAKFFSAMKYSFGDLLKDTGPWLILGVLVGGAISYLIPQSFLEEYVGSGVKAMVIMLIIGMPMYVCATGSIPIAAALMLNGVSPGAAFVFLLSGPASNAVGMTLIAKEMGKRELLIYIFSIAVSSVAFGLVLDVFSGYISIPSMRKAPYSTGHAAGIVELISSVVLVAFILYNLLSASTKKGKHVLQ
jgi:uncharacterized membrane protein YraQ (UPF0718 family)